VAQSVDCRVYFAGPPMRHRFMVDIVIIESSWWVDHLMFGLAVASFLYAVITR
jgi:hypothetical protein